MSIESLQDTGSAIPAGQRPGRPTRIGSLDFARGVVMLLMAIDHVRVYSGLPAGGPTPGIFFTRWITHFVAPAFVFLAGTAAYLHGQKIGRGALVRFLVTRGIWLILLELTVIRLAWTFNLDFQHYLLAGVIWMLGWCMILLAPLSLLPTRVVGGFGVLVILGHNLLDRLTPGSISAIREGGSGWLFSLLYGGGGIQLGSTGPELVVLYVIVPWIGVMAAGYGFGAVARFTPERRRRFGLGLGVALTVAFVVLRWLNGYGDPRGWNPGATDGPPALLRFLATSKYPASLQFLLMTLGPLLILLGVAERWRGALVRVVTVFGRVPLFYYLLHIPLIHALALLVSRVRTGQVSPWLFENHPMRNPPAPDGYAWSLPLLYVMTALAVLLLYFPCRWYAEKKAASRSRWLSYL